MNERLTAAEAAKAAIFLLGQFPHLAKGDQIFLQALADTIQMFPRNVVSDCLNPKIGYASRYPSVSVFHLNEWCSDRAERYWEQWDSQNRIKRQIDERSEQFPKTERGLAAARAWLDRTDPKAMQLTEQMPKNTQCQKAVPGQRLTYVEFLALKTNRPPIGRFPSKFDPVNTKLNRPTPDQAKVAREKLIAEFGEEAFNAVPDQPITFRKLA